MSILLIHPNGDPGAISRGIGLQPSRAWKRREPRSTPEGANLEGTWRDTRWSHVFDLPKNATIETAIAAALGRLSAARSFLATLRETGGTGELIIGLSGNAHHGASVGSQYLKALADLGVSLGIEVCP
jgi:hypothetical protein